MEQGSPPIVLHVLEALRGGTSRHVVDVVTNTTGFGHHVAVPPKGRSAEQSGASVDRLALPKMAEAGAVIHRVDMTRNPIHPINGVAVLRLRRLIRRLRPAVVHGHSSVGGGVARAAAWGTGLPTVYTPNGIAEGRMAIRTERLLGRRTDRFIAVSESEGQLAVELGLVKPAQVVVIVNGIELEVPPTTHRDLRALIGIPASVPLVGTVGRLVPQKAPEDFVRVCGAVAKRRGDVHFLLIGMGPLQARIDALVRSFGLGDRFHQIEYLADAANSLSQLDVFVMPSQFEGGPYTPLEAMRAKVPVVLTDVVGNRGVVEDGLSGLLYPFGATEALAGGVVELLDDSELRAKLVAGATERLHANYDVKMMGERLAQLYRDLRPVSR